MQKEKNVFNEFKHDFMRIYANAGHMTSLIVVTLKANLSVINYHIQSNV